MQRAAWTLALVLAAAAPDIAWGQVFIASRAHPEFTIGPLFIRATVTPDTEVVTLDVLWSLVIPPDTNGAAIRRAYDARRSLNPRPPRRRSGRLTGSAKLPHIDPH